MTYCVPGAMAHSKDRLSGELRIPEEAAFPAVPSSVSGLTPFSATTALPAPGLDLLASAPLHFSAPGPFAADSPFDVGLDILLANAAPQGMTGVPGSTDNAGPPSWLLGSQPLTLGLPSLAGGPEQAQPQDVEVNGSHPPAAQRSSSNEVGHDAATHGAEHAESGHERLAVKHTRRAEQNRRAQAKFRQRKKDKLSEMEKQLAAMSAQMERLLEEKEAYAERAFRLQQSVEQKDAQLSTLKGESKGVLASEELVSAFWEMVMELKHGNSAGLGCTRPQVQDMVHGLLNWRAPDLGFIRREIVGQLVECCQQGADVEASPAHQRLHRLVKAYNKMVHRCGETNPLAFRTFLSLQLPEQQGRRTDAAFWRGVADSGKLAPWQRQQLTGAYQQLVEKMRALMERRDGAGLVAAPGAGGVLHSMDQAKEVLDLHEHILKEEQAAVFNFRTAFSLAVEPSQQAQLMISSFPFSLDTLAVCAVIAAAQPQPAATVAGGAGARESNSLPFLGGLPTNSPFQSLAPRLGRP